MKTLVSCCIALILFMLPGCGNNSSSSPASISLKVKMAHDFNPNAEHGRIDFFRIIITGDSLAEPLVKEFPYGTATATIDELSAGDEILIVVEAINTNGVCVRRGRSEKVTVQSGTATPVTLTINNVPIFANVRNGAVVYNTRFSPKVFAPGEITFQINHDFNGSVSTLEDVISEQSSFSISTSVEDAILSINTQTFTPGIHTLTVEDITSGESSSVTITVLDGSNARGLASSAGGLLGTPIGSSSNLGIYQVFKLNQM